MAKAWQTDRENLIVNPDKSEQGVNTSTQSLKIDSTLKSSTWLQQPLRI